MEKIQDWKGNKGYRRAPMGAPGWSTCGMCHHGEEYGVGGCQTLCVHPENGDPLGSRVVDRYSTCIEHWHRGTEVVLRLTEGQSGSLSTMLNVILRECYPASHNPISKEYAERMNGIFRQLTGLDHHEFCRTYMDMPEARGHIASKHGRGPGEVIS